MFVTELLKHIFKDYQFTSVDKELFSKHPSSCLTAPALLVCQSSIPTSILISHKLWFVIDFQGNIYVSIEIICDVPNSQINVGIISFNF